MLTYPTTFRFFQPEAMEQKGSEPAVYILLKQFQLQTAKLISAKCKSVHYRTIASLLQHITKPKWQKGRGKFQYCLVHTRYTLCLCSVWILIQGVNTGYIVRNPTGTSSKYCVSSSLIVHTRLP